MTDLTKGIIEIEGVVLSKNTNAIDFINLNNPNINVKVSKRGHTYIKFLNPIVANNIAMFVEVACYTDSDIPKIKLFPSVPPSVIDNGYGEIPKYKVKASKQWLKEMIEETPSSESKESILYAYKWGYIRSATRDDIHYGLIGDEIDICYEV